MRFAVYQVADPDPLRPNTAPTVVDQVGCVLARTAREALDVARAAFTPRDGWWIEVDRWGKLPPTNRPASSPSILHPFEVAEWWRGVRRP